MKLIEIRNECIENWREQSIEDLSKIVDTVYNLQHSGIKINSRKNKEMLFFLRISLPKWFFEFILFRKTNKICNEFHKQFYERIDPQVELFYTEHPEAR